MSFEVCFDEPKGPGRGRPRLPMWPRIDRTETCWLWTGPLNPKGYGVLRCTLVHRVVYEMLVGPIPAGLQLDHLCHNEDFDCLGGPTCVHRRCVNPAHLLPSTAKENTRRSRNTPAAKNVLKTVCINGHDYSPENTAVYGGKRYCRQCYRARRRKVAQP